MDRLLYYGDEATKAVCQSVILGGEMRGDKMCWVSPRNVSLGRKLRDPLVCALILQIKKVSPSEKVNCSNLQFSNRHKQEGWLSDTIHNIWLFPHILLFTVTLLDVSCSPLVLVTPSFHFHKHIGRKSREEEGIVNTVIFSTSKGLPRYFHSGYAADLAFKYTCFYVLALLWPSV